MIAAGNDKESTLIEIRDISTIVESRPVTALLEYSNAHQDKVSLEGRNIDKLEQFSRYLFPIG